MFRCLAYCTVHSGVETGGSGGTMNRGPKLLGGPSPWPKNFTAEKVIYLAENTKNIKTLGVGGLHRFPDPVAGPRAPKPHLRSQHFGLPVEGIEGPQVTVEPEPLRALLRHCVQCNRRGIGTCASLCVSSDFIEPVALDRHCTV